MDARSLPARILWLLGAACILVLAFFFLVAAIVAGVLLAAGLLARVWWMGRKIRKAAEAGIVTTEYRVIERERIAAPRLPEGNGPLAEPGAEADRKPPPPDRS